MPYHWDDKWTFIFAGDFHFGSRQCDEVLIRKFVNKYKDEEKVRIFLLGDEIDAVTRVDKRYTPSCMNRKYVGEDDPVNLMLADFLSLMEPLKGKILAGVDSNHNVTYRGQSGYDIHRSIAEGLRFERLGYGGWVNIMWDWHKKQNSRANRVRITSFHITHGKPSCAYTKAGKIASMERDAWYFSGDLMVHGHTHLLATPPSNIYFDAVPGKSTYIKRKQRLLNSGSFLKSYSMDESAPYSEIKRYPPIDMGWGVADVEFRSGEPQLTTYTKEY